MNTEDFYGIITEDYVNFNIAKLLKEKGFMDGAIVKFFASGYDKNGNILSIEKTELKDYPRPTIQMAMKWLRKKYDLFIRITEDITGNVFEWSVYQKNYGCKISTCVEDSYEEACETAIKYCLENLI